MKQLVLVLGLALAACGGSKTDDAVDRLEGFKDRMCACAGMDCVMEVQAAWREWRKGTGLKKEDFSEAQNARAARIDREMDACRNRIRKTAS